jgi:hypothetical protein
MKSPISIICASALMATVSLGEVAAAPLSLNLPATASGGSDVVQVRDNVRWPRMRGGGGKWNGNGRYWQNGRNWKHSPTWRPGWGYRNGWNNYYNDGWYGGSGIYLGGGALLLGALVGSALANNNYRGVYGNSHVQWCANRYRSYSPRSDTYQPYNGPRRRCISPY